MSQIIIFILLLSKSFGKTHMYIKQYLGSVGLQLLFHKLYLTSNFSRFVFKCVIIMDNPSFVMAVFCKSSDDNWLHLLTSDKISSSFINSKPARFNLVIPGVRWWVKKLTEFSVSSVELRFNSFNSKQLVMIHCIQSKVRPLQYDRSKRWVLFDSHKNKWHDKFFEGQNKTFLLSTQNTVIKLIARFHK